MTDELRRSEVVLERAEEGGFVVSVPDLPGVWTQGETRDEALANVREAITGYLDTLDAEGWAIPALDVPRRKAISTSARRRRGRRRTSR